MRTYLVAFFGMLMLCGYAQDGSRYAVAKVPDFMNTTLIVILDDLENGHETTYSVALKQAVSNSWDLSPYVFKYASELDEFLPADGFSMLLRGVRQGGNPEGYTYQTHSNISIMLCNRDSIQHYGIGDEISVLHMKDADNTEEIEYKLSLMLKVMQQYVRFLADKKTDEQHFFKDMKIFHTQNRKKAKDKPLYICEEELPEKMDVSQIGKYYNGEVRILPRKELKYILNKGTEDACFFLIEPDFKKLWLVQISDGKVLYVTKPKTRKKLSLDDFKEISKKIS